MFLSWNNWDCLSRTSIGTETMSPLVTAVSPTVSTYTVLNKYVIINWKSYGEDWHYINQPICRHSKFVRISLWLIWVGPSMCFTFSILLEMFFICWGWYLAEFVIMFGLILMGKHIYFIFEIYFTVVTRSSVIQNSIEKVKCINDRRGDLQGFSLKLL